MADKKKSPKASSKPKNNNQAVATTPKVEQADVEVVEDVKVTDAQKSKQTKDLAKTKSAKTEKSTKDKPEKGGKKVLRSIKHFFKDLKSETKKISWNSNEDTFKSTGVVLLVVLIVGAGIWLVDFGLTNLREFLFELSKSSAEEARIMLSMMLSGLM